MPYFVKERSLYSFNDNRIEVLQHLISGITAVFRKNLSSKYPPLLCDEKCKARYALIKLLPYHKCLKFSSLSLSESAALLSFYNMKRRTCCKDIKKI